MSDPKLALIFVPLFGSILSQFLFGRVKEKNYRKVWFQPPGYLFLSAWIAIYILLGFILYDSYIRMDYLVMGLVIANFIVSYIWLFTFNYLQNYKVSILVILILLILSLELLVALLDNFYASEILYSYPPYIGWLIFALILASDTKKK